MKRVLSFLLVVVFIVCCFSISGLATDGLSDDERLVIMDGVRNHQYHLSDMVDLMSVDAGLESDIWKWLDENAMPLLDDVVDENGVSAQSYFEEWVIDRPDLTTIGSQVCKLYVELSNGKIAQGSCFLVDGSVCVTAAHCLYALMDSETGERDMIVSAVLDPGWYCDADGEIHHPYGYAVGDIDKAYIPDLWYSVGLPCERDVSFDFAVMPLSDCVGDFENLQVAQPRLTILANYGSENDYVWPVGYSGFDSLDANLVNLVGCIASYKSVENCYNVYQMDYRGHSGMSGCPVYDLEGYVVGIYHGGQDGDDSNSIGYFRGFDNNSISTIQTYIDGKYWDKVSGSWKSRID